MSEWVLSTTAGKIQGLTQHWVFLTIAWRGADNRIEWREHAREVRVWAANLILSLVLLVTSGRQLNLFEIYFIF